MTRILAVIFAVAGFSFFASDASAQCYGRGYARPAVSFGYSSFSRPVYPAYNYVRPRTTFAIGYSSGFGGFAPYRPIGPGIYGGYGYRPSPYYRIPNYRPAYGRSGVGVYFRY